MKTVTVSAVFTAMFPAHSTEPGIELGLHKHNGNPLQYSCLGREESDTTERLDFHFSLSCIGEGNGNPLQCSCLENPRDWGDWWAAVHGVT